MTASRRRVVIVGFVLPAVLLVLSLAVMAWALPLMPSPIALHWGPSGQPDGFGSAVVAFLLLPVIIVAWLAFALVVVRRTPQDGPTANQKLMLVTGVFLSTFVGVLMAGSFVIQRGVENAADSGSLYPVLIIGAVAAVVVSIIAWYGLPPVAVPQAPASAAEPPARDLGATERVVWVRRVEPRSPGLAVVLGIAGVLIVSGALITAATQPLWALVFLAPAALIAFGYALSFWTVTIDRHGLVACGGPGWPLIRVPIDTIVEAQVVQIDPLVDFGGWGLRWAPHRTGIVLRGGPAFEVRRSTGRDLVITTSDPNEPAELLNALVRRQRDSRGE